MGFKTIKGRSYFYETRRVNGRHETSYVGGGAVGDLAAAAAERRRSRRDAERRAEDATRRRWATEDAQAADLFGRVERAFRAALEGCGYRRHNRGEWRRRRAMGEAEGGRKALTNEEAMALMNRLAVPYGEASRADEAEGRRQLDDDPRGRRFRDSISPEGNALKSELDAAGRNSTVHKLAAESKVEALRRELYGADPTDLERLLADRVVFCWLHLYRLESRDASGTIALVNLHDRRVDRAHKRYLSALKALAVVRKLAPGGAVTMTQSVSVTLRDPAPPGIDVTPGADAAALGPAPKGDRPYPLNRRVFQSNG